MINPVLVIRLCFFTVLLLFFLPISQQRSLQQLEISSSTTPNSDDDLQAIAFPLKIPITGDEDSGLLLLHLNIGDPPQALNLIADTGGDATWVYCRSNNEEALVDSNLRRTFFDPSRSSTFVPLSCLLQNGCDYFVEYEDGTITSGFYANEKLTVHEGLGSKMELNNVTIGCSSGDLNDELIEADGILGLSPSRRSFTRRVVPEFGMKFSFVLPRDIDPTTQSMLVFGDARKIGNNIIGTRKLEYTKLVDTESEFYYVEVYGIFIDGVMLEIPKSVWELNTTDHGRGGGVILDTGTVFTYVPRLVFNAIQAVYFTFLYNMNVETTDADDYLCFDPTAAPEFDVLRFPRMSIEFGEKTRFEIHEENLFYENEEGRKCLGFRAVDGDGGGVGYIIGNILQRGYLWEYDLLNERVGFTSL